MEAHQVAMINAQEAVKAALNHFTSLQIAGSFVGLIVEAVTRSDDVAGAWDVTLSYAVKAPADLLGLPGPRRSSIIEVGPDGSFRGMFSPTRGSPST